MSMNELNTTARSLLNIRAMTAELEAEAEALVLSAPLPPPARFLLWVKLWVRN